MSIHLSLRRTLSTITTAFLVSLVALAASAYGQAPPPPAPEFHVTRPSAYDFDETLVRIKQAIEGENLMVVHEINAQQMLRMVGMRSGGMRQILFFHPRYMKQIIETNRNGGIEPPLKVLVMETPNGQVMVRYEDPRRVSSHYGRARHGGLGDSRPRRRPRGRRDPRVAPG